MVVIPSLYIHVFDSTLQRVFTIFFFLNKTKSTLVAHAYIYEGTYASNVNDMNAYLYMWVIWKGVLFPKPEELHVPDKVWVVKCYDGIFLVWNETF